MNESVPVKTGEVEQLDIVSFLFDALHRLRSFWWIILLLTVLFAGAFYYRSSVSYVPNYVAESTVSVEIINGGTYSNQNTARQMGVVFPYILTSGALSDVISSDLGTDGVPGSISVNAIEGTNLLTISVSGSDPEMTYRVLQSVLKNYPEVAQYVVGQTKLTVIDDSGVPGDTGRESVLRGSATRGAAVGFVIGLVLLILYTISSRTVRTEEDLRALLNVTCLGTLPVCKKKKRSRNVSREINILYDTNQGEYIESMRLIRTRLERQMGDKQVLMVTSSIPGEGKSTVAANLAVSMAKKNKRVVLVDCDLRNPTQGKIFNLEGGNPGLVSVLTGKAALRDALVEISDKGVPLGLTLLPGSDKESRLVEIMGSEAMSQMVEELKKHADVVILDTPPSAMLVDATLLARHVDGVAYVVMSDFAKRRFIYKGMEELSNNGVPIFGCILNGGKRRSGRGYGYGYYGYGYGYGSKSKS